MKYTKLLMVLMVLTLFGVFQASCGGGGSGTVADDGGDDDPVVVGSDVVELTSGMEDVATDAVLKYTFASALDAASITTSTVYVVPLEAVVSADISVEFDITIGDYSYAADCDSDTALSGISVESDGESVTITSAYEYMGGVIYSLCVDGEAVGVVFSTEGDLATDCAALFNGTSCEFDDEEEEGTLNYDGLIEYVDEDGAEDCICIYAVALGESGCIDASTLEGDDLSMCLGDEDEGDEGDEEENGISWGDETPTVEDNVVLVESLSGEGTLFTMQAVNVDDEETWGANPYMLYADTADTTDIARADLEWSYDDFIDDDEDNCMVAGTCSFAITRAILDNIITDYDAETWVAEDRCVTLHWIMYLGCTISGDPGDACDANDTFTEDRTVYIKSADNACDHLWD